MESPSYGAGVPKETGAEAMPAALEEKASETTGAALAAKKAIPAEKEASLAEKELGWKAENGIKEMCEDSWRWQKNNPNGYEE